MQFENFSLKKHFSKIALLKNSFSKLLPPKMHFQSCSLNPNKDGLFESSFFPGGGGVGGSGQFDHLFIFQEELI